MKTKNTNQQTATHQKPKGKWTVAKVLKKSGQIVLGIGCGALAIEATASAATSTVADVKAGCAYSDYKRHPEKYTRTVKTGLFKKETVLVNPVTGSISKVNKK